MKKILVLTSLFACSFVSSAWADWTLNKKESALQFVSIKKNSIAEIHQFGELSGNLNKDGHLSVNIELASVKTGVDIRNTRMQENLFEIAKFPLATVTADINIAAISTLKPGQSLTIAQSLALNLHGKTANYVAELIVSARTDGALTAITAAPILVNASDFGLETGIETLKTLAGLDAIAASVPVTVQLVMEPRAITRAAK